MRQLQNAAARHSPQPQVAWLEAIVVSPGHAARSRRGPAAGSRRMSCHATLDRFLHPRADMAETATLMEIITSVVGAFLLALPIAWEREKRTRLAGLRTFPITAVGSCAFVLAASEFAAGDADAQARIVQGLITGVGFIGGGAILKGESRVRGTATAASLWGTGALGLAAAYDRWDIAAVISGTIFLTFRVLTPLKDRWIEETEESE